MKQVASVSPLPCTRGRGAGGEGASRHAVRGPPPPPPRARGGGGGGGGGRVVTRSGPLTPIPSPPEYRGRGEQATTHCLPADNNEILCVSMYLRLGILRMSDSRQAAVCILVQ